MNTHELTQFSDFSENEPQSNSVQEDHRNDRSIDCQYKARTDDKIGREIEYYYNMNNKNRGLALIFNHEKYHDDNWSRDGTCVDSERLCETLHLLNFDVRVYDDLLSSDLSQVIEEGILLLISFKLKFNTKHFCS